MRRRPFVGCERFREKIEIKILVKNSKPVFFLDSNMILKMPFDHLESLNEPKKPKNRIRSTYAILKIT